MPRFYSHPHSKGFTLTEVMIVVAILAILAAWAVPSFEQMRNRNYVRGVSESLLGRLAESRLQAIRSNEITNVSFDDILSGVDTETTVSTPTFEDIQLDSKLAMLVDPASAGFVDLTKGRFTIRFGITPVGQGYAPTVV